MGSRPRAEQEMERLIAEISILEQTAEAVRQRLNLVESNRIEYQSTYEAINALKKEKPGVEALIPIGSGSYVRGRIMDVEKILVNIGSNVYVEKELDEALKIIEGRIDRASKLKDTLQQQLISVLQRLEENRRRLAELARTVEAGRAAGGS